MWSSEPVYMRAANAGASAVGKVVTNAIGVPVIGDVLGWGVENSIKFLLAWADAAVRHEAECQHLSEMLGWPQLHQGLVDLDQVTDFPGEYAYRSTYREICEVLAELNFLLAQAKASEQAGLPEKVWHTLKDSFKSMMDDRTIIKESLSDLCSHERHLQIRTFLQTATFVAKVRIRTPRAHTPMTSAPKLPTPFVQHGADLVPHISNLLRTTRNIGIVGMPGIGKTAVARAVFERARTRGRAAFAKTVWLTIGFDEAGQQSVLCMLQLLKSAFEQLSNRGVKSTCDTPELARQELEELLIGLTQDPQWSVLLVLDNVWDSTAMATLNFSTRCYGRARPAAGSRLIVTTRQRSTLSEAPRPRVGEAPALDSLHVVDVPRLNKQHAHRLFHLCAHEYNMKQGLGTMNPADMCFWPAVRAQLLHECGGNPSALIHVAHSVRCARPEHWERDLTKCHENIRKGKDKVSEACDDSIDALPESVQECFFTFAAFPPDVPVPEADVVHLFATRAPLPTPASVQAAACKLQELVQCSLVNMAEDSGRRLVSMHPILHRIAARRASEVPGLANPKHLQVSGQAADPLQCLSIQHKLHSICLADVLKPYDGEGSKLHACMVRCVKNESPPAKWPPRLRYLHLRGQPPQSSKGTDQEQQLVLSRTRTSTRRLLPSRKKSAAADMVPVVLNSLNLAGSIASAEPLQCFLPANQLLHLDLSGCGGLESLPESLGLCGWLVHLNLSRCKQLKELPAGIGMCSHLEDLDLSECVSLGSLSTGIQACSALMQLNLSGCSHSQLDLPPELGSCKLLSHLNLSGFSTSGPTSLPDFFENLSSGAKLKHVDISGCSELKALPPKIGVCSYLTHLDLSGCSGLGSHGSEPAIPSSIASCAELVCLDLSNCRRLTALPDDISECKKLMYLNLWGCLSLVSLPRTLNDSSQLVHATLGNHIQLTDVPACIGHHPNLAHLSLRQFNRLTSLPSHVPDAAHSYHLTRLDLDHCDALQQFPETSTRYSSLVHLHIKACTSQTFQLPPWIGECIHLTHLALECCSHVALLPTSITHCTQLEHLNLNGCPVLSRLPDEIGSCRQLTHINLNGCSALTKLPSSIVECSELAHLSLQKCSSLAALPEGISQCIQLTHLDLSECTVLQLSEEHSFAGEGNQLAFLSLRGWSHVDSLPACIGLCGHVTHLDVSMCTQVEKFPDNIGSCNLVSQLSFQGCSSVTHLPSSIGQCIHMTSLDLRQCDRLEKLPTEIARCTRLSKLMIDSAKLSSTDIREFRSLPAAQDFQWMYS